MHQLMVHRFWKLLKQESFDITAYISWDECTHQSGSLGISAATIMPYRKINPLKKDFENINTVIASINQNVQDSLNKICYPVDLVDKLSNGKDNAVPDFAISKARDTSK